MRGIVWGSSFQIAKNKLKEIEEQYERLGYKPLTKRNGNASNTYELVYANGDMWQAVRAGENARGYKVNVSYIDRSISDYLIDAVIKQLPCPSRTSIATLGFSSFLYAKSTKAPAILSAILSGCLGFTFSNIINISFL